MHVLALTTHVETITSRIWPRWSTYGHVVERSFDSVDVFRQTRIWPRMIATIRYEMYRELCERATELQRQDDLYEDGSFPMSFAYLHARPGEDGITEDYLATLQCARSQVQ
jgi:hypothetical protein